MKVAVFISGQLRELNKTWQRLITMFQKAEVDFYFHLWENDQFEKEWVLQTIKPVNYMFEPQIDFNPQVKLINKYEKRSDKPQIIFNTCSQYYSVSQSKHIIENPDQYDFIVKIRTDMYFDSSLDKLLAEAKGDELLVSMLRGNEVRYPQLGDISFLTTPHTFKKFFKLYDFLIKPEKWANKFLPKFTSHFMLKLFVDHFDIKYRHVPFNFILLRSNISGNTYEEMMKSYKQFFRSSPTQQKLFLYNNPHRLKEFENIT